MSNDGGAEGARTPDLLNAIQALYQLSYDPIKSQQCKNIAAIVKTKFGLASSCELIQAKNLSPFGCDHRMMPRRIPNDVNHRLFDSRQ